MITFLFFFVCVFPIVCLAIWGGQFGITYLQTKMEDFQQTASIRPTPGPAPGSSTVPQVNTILSTSPPKRE
jgi:hypothetical protein